MHGNFHHCLVCELVFCFIEILGGFMSHFCFNKPLVTSTDIKSSWHVRRSNRHCDHNSLCNRWGRFIIGFFVGFLVRKSAGFCPLQPVVAQTLHINWTLCLLTVGFAQVWSLSLAGTFKCVGQTEQAAITNQQIRVDYLPRRLNPRQLLNKHRWWEPAYGLETDQEVLHTRWAS